MYFNKLVCFNGKRLHSFKKFAIFSLLLIFSNIVILREPNAEVILNQTSKKHYSVFLKQHTKHFQQEFNHEKFYPS